MKKIKSLRGRIFVDIMIVAMFPILIFAIISQGNLRARRRMIYRNGCRQILRMQIDALIFS